MRTRSKSSAQRRSPGMDGAKKAPTRESGSCLDLLNDSGKLADMSQEILGKRGIQANSCSSMEMEKVENSLRRSEYVAMSETGLKLNVKQDGVTKNRPSVSGVGGCKTDALGNTLRVENDNERSSPQNFPGSGEEMDDSDWEDGSIPIFNSTYNNSEKLKKGLTIELGEFTDSTKRKPVRRASAEDRGLAELVHKAHLLCLLARGRLIDSACDDPLIQASLLSLLLRHLLAISECAKLTANALIPLVNWFRNNFHARSPSDVEKPFHSALACALETHEGTSEEVAALSVALFRALKLTTRFVCIMDVASLKPGADKSESSSQDANRMGRGLFNTSTLMVPREISVSPVKSLSCNEIDNVHETSLRGSCESKRNHSVNDNNQSIDSPTALNDSHGPKRKGDLEFEMQMEMAISSTAAGARNSEIEPHVKGLNSDSTKFSSQKRLKTSNSEECTTSSQGFSTAFGSRKVGSPMYWAEVYCSGENLTGKWVHVDAVNAIVDGEQKVEAAAVACKTSLRYVVAFAGHGAKDVTRRYCRKWYKIAPQRINSIWWNAVLGPLKELEAGATGGMVHLDVANIDASNACEKGKASRSGDFPTQNDLPGQANMPEKTDMAVLKDHGKNIDRMASATDAFVATRNSLEDMELETRALTEPLPTNQQAYKSHQLYAIERWLTKYQMLHPKGPILGLCSGHPVYPRTCVQTLQTKDRWLREGLQVKANELPAKVLKHHLKPSKSQVSDSDDNGGGDSDGIIELYGKWQLEPLCLPHAVNGIVPKNERGQVDVWCEKSLPPGTVHLRLPKVFSVAKRLGIDYAPAMVGFEFRNGRSNPVFDGIVVCAEFKDAILEAFAEENERRETEEKKRNERLAISRWYQLLSSIIIRQRLDSCYKDNVSSSQTCSNIKISNSQSNAEESEIGGTLRHKQSAQSQNKNQNRNVRKTNLNAPSTALKEDNHEHVFLADDQSFDDKRSILTKRCHCGFSVQSEVL